MSPPSRTKQFIQSIFRPKGTAVSPQSEPGPTAVASFGTSLPPAVESRPNELLAEHEPAGEISERDPSPANRHAVSPATDTKKLDSDNEPDGREPTKHGQQLVEDAESKNLWNEAYERLRQENSKLVDTYEKDLLASSSPELQKSGAESGADPPAGTGGKNREEQLQNLVKGRLDSMQKARLKVTVGGEEIIVKDQVCKVIRTIISRRDIIGAAISTEPHASLAWAGILIILPLLSNPVTQSDDAIDGLSYVSDLLVRCRVNELTYHLSSPNFNQMKPTPQIQSLAIQLRTNTISLYLDILKYQMYIACQYSRAGFFRLIRDLVAADDWKGMLGSLKETENAINRDIKTIDSSALGTIGVNLTELQGKADDMLIGLSEVRSEVETINQTQKLAKLPCAEYAAFNTFKKDAPPPSKCHEGTRAEILDDIQKWGEGHGNSCIFWLSGMAGTGKSAIARTVADVFHRKKRLGASFFFSRGQGLRAEVTAFFTTIAIQLITTVPDLTPHICNSISHNGEIHEQSLSNQWELLILRPLSTLGARILVPLVLVLVIDALDECMGTEYIPEILQLLTRANNLKMIQLRIFITSRRERHIHDSFRGIPEIVHHDLILDSGLDGRTERDISIFLRHGLAEVAKTRGLGEWPSETDTRELIKRAGRLFIYASTACRYLQNSKYPKKRLPEMLDASLGGHSSARELDNMYMLVLRQPITDCCDEDRNDSIALFQRILGSIVVLPETLSSVTLAKLLDVRKDEITDTLEPLRSVLNIPNDDTSPIEIFHLSFHDFLLDNRRCTDPRLWVDEEQTHKYLFGRCLELMFDYLRQDICGFRMPGVLASEVEKCKVDSCIPLTVQYACRYWISHLQGAKLAVRDDDQLHIFFRERILHWLEALSLIGKTSEGILAITALEPQVVAKESPEFHKLIYDAKRFILYNRSTIEEAPLQIYSSALIFTPEMSIIRKQFEEQVPRWICGFPKVQKDWSSLEQTLQGHSDSVTSVAFSPDGSKLASGSDDNTVRVWNVATGQAEQTLEGHSNSVMSVAFSPDGSRLASGSDDNTVRVWNAVTGQAEQTFKGHSYSVTSVAFSPDGSRLASGSDDETVWVWNVATGQAEQTFEGHSDRVTSVAFSPDGSKLVSGSDDNTVQVWNVATGQAEQTLEDHSNSVTSVAFSPDGSRLASGSDDNTVRVWNVATGQAEQTLEGHSCSVTSVAFSPDGSRLASGSDDETVRVWNVATGQAEQTLKAHSYWVTSVAFSPDGSRLASGSYDDTVQVWNVAMGQAEQTLEGYSNWVTSVAFSPDGSRLASGSHDKTVRVWNVATGQADQTLEGHSDRVTSVVFSPDGSKLTSGSDDNTVRVWNVATGQAERMLEGHSNRVTSVAFSPDGSRLASGSDDNTVRVWNVATGQAEQTLEGHSNSVTSVAFSPDGSRLASGSDDETARVWNVATGQAEQTLEGHSYSVTSVAFSPGGGRLASGSHDGTVRVWNVATGQAEQTLEGHSNWVTNVAFAHRRITWITRNGSRILYLPLDYRPRVVITKGNILGIGALTGRVIILTFNFDIEKEMN